jgi:hypothetical protein
MHGLFHHKGTKAQSITHFLVPSCLCGEIRLSSPRAAANALAQKLPISIQPQKLNSAKISFSNLGPWRISLNAASNATNGKTCPRRAVGMAPGVFAHDPNGSISDVPESAARMTA